jgi:hypothetical protein
MTPYKASPCRTFNTTGENCSHKMYLIYTNKNQHANKRKGQLLGDKPEPDCRKKWHEELKMKKLPRALESCH